MRENQMRKIQKAKNQNTKIQKYKNTKIGNISFPVYALWFLS